MTGGTKMKFNKWTLGLAALGVVSLASAAKAADTAAVASSVSTALSATTLSGYVDTSGEVTSGGKTVTPPYTVGGTARNSFNLNVVDLKLSKPQDEGQWASGYTVELWAGPNANGLASASTTSAGSSDFAIRQAYVSLRTPLGNGIDWKIGVFDTIIGYESLTSGSNPNYTHSYGFQIEPTTHTGILGSYRISDMISITAGIANTSYKSTVLATGGNIATINNGASNPTTMAAIALTAPDSWGWVKGNALFGRRQYPALAYVPESGRSHQRLRRCHRADPVEHPQIRCGVRLFERAHQGHHVRRNRTA